MIENTTVQKPSNAVRISEYLSTHYIKKEDLGKDNQGIDKSITNTRIKGGPESGISGGTYYIPDNEYDDFVKKIYRDIIQKNGKEYLTEAQLPTGGPIAIDIDLRFSYETTERLYTKDHIEDLLGFYIKELQKIYQFDETVKIPIYVLEKKTVNRLEDKQITKDGIHIIIGLQADRTVQIYLRKQILKHIAEAWSDLPIINEWTDVLDEGISIGCTNWQLIGCRKPNHEPYELKHVYNVNVDPADGEIMMQPAELATVLNIDNIAKLSVRYRLHQSLFMKSEFIKTYESLAGVPLKRKPSTQSIVSNMVGMQSEQAIFNIRSAEDMQIAIARFLESLQKTQHDLREAHDYTMALPASYYGPGSFTNWIRVGWALRNISDSLFIVWAAFSSQAPNFDYTCIRDDLWAKWLTFDMNRPDGLTKRSIMHWCKKDAQPAYQKVRYASVDHFIDQTINSFSIEGGRSNGKGSYDIATVLHQLFKDEYVCVSVKSSIWYRYKNHRWSEIDSGTTLRRAISDELRDLYSEKVNKLIADKNRLDPDDDEKIKAIMAKMNVVLDICTRLGSTPDKQNIMTEARELFYDGTFLKKLDMNPYLMCFSNGVIDFKEKRFRNGYPEDNLSKCTNIDYVPLNDLKHGTIIADIRDFMRKLFPVAELNQYMWDHLASTMTGLTTNQTFNMYIGVGSNGKSVLVNLMEKILGDYKGDVPLSLITQPRTKIGSASPEIAALRGVRFAVMQEPSKGDKIIEGQLKALTGGDPLTGRALYMDNITFIPQFKLVVCTNEFMDVKSNDHGTWRRICVVEYMSLFTDTPVSDDPDKPYQYKLDKYINEKFAEWAPIFASMLVDRVYETNGNVHIPEMVKSASNAYREQQDYIAEFVRDRIGKSPTDCIQKNMLANVFKEWYNTNYGNRVPNIKEIIAFMDKQFGKQRNGVWAGVKIKFDGDFSRQTMPSIASGSTSCADEDMDDIDIEEL
jgi:P4 family phage/plasmid primase-like protien